MAFPGAGGGECAPSPGPKGNPFTGAKSKSSKKGGKKGFRFSKKGARK